MKRIERVRLYPTPRQERALRFMLDVTRELYNALLQERRDAYRLRSMTVTSKQQYAEITALRTPSQWIDRRLAAVYRECEDAVLHRLDLAFAAFFRRCKRGETPGFPRFKPAARWSQLEFPHGNRALRLDERQRRVTVPGVGSVTLRKGRAVPAFGRAWIAARNGRWYACFECERAVQPLPSDAEVIGTIAACTCWRHSRAVRSWVSSLWGSGAKRPWRDSSTSWRRSRSVTKPAACAIDTIRIDLRRFVD